MKYYLVLFFVLTVSIFGQNPVVVQDTINVVTLQSFNVPKSKYIVMANIRSLKVTAELFDKDMQKIRDCNDYWQYPSPKDLANQLKGKRGATIQYVLHESIDKIGTYYVKTTVDYQGEEGSGTTAAYYMINVDYPHMGAAIKLRPNYFYSEKETFSFSVLEFQDPNAYGYQIVDDAGAEIETGKGAIVSLNSVLKNIKYVGRKIKVIGTYQGQQFQYKPLTGGDVKESVWEFVIDKPTLDEFSDWKKDNDKDQIMISAYSQNAMRILYTYIGNTESGFVVVAPEAKNFKLEADPADMITNISARTQRNFLFITFKISEDYLSTMADCSEKEFTMTIRFTTQFGEKIEKKYTATILK